MNDQTPEMERINAEMREVMRRWIADPTNEQLKRRFSELQNRYTQLFLAFKKARSNSVA